MSTSIKRIYICVFSFLMVLLLPAGEALAQVIPDNAIDDLVEPFEELLDIVPDIRDLASTLFWSLLLLELVISGFSLFWSGADFNAVGRWLVERIIMIIVAIYMFRNGPYIAQLITLTFEAVGVQMGGIQANPTDVIERGILLAAQLQNELSFWDGVNAIPTLLAALILSMIFAGIGANMIVILAELYLLMVAGVFLMGFAGASWTRDFAWGYFRYMISVGFKLLVMQVLVGIGLSVIEAWLTGLNGGDIKNVSLITLISTMVVFYTMVKTLPNSAAELVNGRVGGGFGGVAGSGMQMVSNMRSASSAMSSTASVMKGAAKAMGTAAMASAAAAKTAKAGGATGAAVISGAAGNVAKATGQEVGKSLQGIKGPGSLGQRVNQNLTQRAQAAK